MIFAIIIGVIISIGFYILFLLFRYLINPRFADIEYIGLDTRKRQLIRINKPSDKCPICGNELFFSISNIYMMRGAWYHKYFCRECGKDTALIVLTKEEHEESK